MLLQALLPGPDAVASASRRNSLRATVLPVVMAFFA